MENETKMTNKESEQEPKVRMPKKPEPIKLESEPRFAIRPSSSCEHCCKINLTMDEISPTRIYSSNTPFYNVLLARVC